ncbi:Na+/H+ antiporter subunit E [Brevibacterium aurantiacum]|uniref:Multisubunit sodium/proton antiporter, MrpE subunit n=2 Tax=Brevibacterium aurantiacum TaxID=273384 RepID=A0A2A3ZSQ8_BREAU|nr:Na+/H+ antiporter subunit E [Brevibacterium aurantiacum]MDN6372917.1 Na+/H+ antiporter subunit E [Brevibacterium aurantiacum]PCC47529.1 Na+/H+ antiporter subunit E [Brevibacterium aurantiacum]PCC54395.1 Na+/H+ antiporter subunit E [Brevibacterium aurantiacum]PCC56500.1 Na+/H+ antiporter subunit E [Brevibacterium aurantiacum]SMX76467.1 multisubunit sodium/proton antiporter, MrpE subunit [Brevibacterium aurantiacum]
MNAKRSRMTKGRSFVQQLVLVFFLVVLWVMLWDAVSLMHIITGVILAFVVTRVFYLPPVVLSGRFNIIHALNYGLWFLYSLIYASVEVAWFAFRRRAVGAGSVIACDLRTSSDLLMTLVADTASLIPGSIIIDSDRAQGILYLHVLDCDSEEKILTAKRQVYYIERLLIRAVGSHRDLAALKVDPDPMADDDGGAR